MRLRNRPVGMDVVRSLVESGDVDEGVLARMPTFTLASATWELQDGLKPLSMIGRDVPCKAGGF